MAETFAHPFGVERKVPSSWGRPKASDANPHGTGNGNPLDQGERLITLVHPFDPARAREMAENFVELVDMLDQTEGADHSDCKSDLFQLLAKSIKEHSDVAGLVLKGDLTPEALECAMVELRQAKSALLQLEGGLQELLENGGVHQ